VRLAGSDEEFLVMGRAVGLGRLVAEGKRAHRAPNLAETLARSFG